jgi:phthiodiolone/phenolphthiodiolone dimycocerosates ketoreductase
LAQSFLTIDHIAQGRAFFCLGAGEIKQFAPWSLPREKPFAHLEESIKIIRMLSKTQGLVTYDGPIWQLEKAILAFPPYNNKTPPLMVAEQVKVVKTHAERAGRNPDDVMFGSATTCLIAPTEKMVDDATANLALRWDAAALVPGPDAWERSGVKNPLGDWSYPRDLVPMDWSREDALKIANQVPPEIVRKMRFCGTPQSVADQLQPYIDAGLNMILVGNYAELVQSGDWGDAMAGQSVVTQTYDVIRKRNGMPTLAST